MRNSVGARTLHITNFYHPTSGGIRAYYRALLGAAVAAGRFTSLVVPGEHDGLEELGDGVRIHTVRAPRAPTFDRRYRLILPHHFLRPWGGRLRAILEQESPDLVEINDKVALCFLAGPLRKAWWRGPGRPTVIGHSAERFSDSLRALVSHSPAASAFSRWYMRRIYVPLFDYHLANSRYTAAEIQSVLPPWRHEHLAWRPMGIDIARYGASRRDPVLRTGLLARLGATADSTLLLYAGRLSPEKQVGRLLDMLCRLVASGLDVRLVLAGDGPLAAALDDAASGEFAGRLLLLGHVDAPGALARLLASADLFVHPNDREPFGIGPLEAMACGTPVVAPAAGGLLEYASPDTAWLGHPSGEGLATMVAQACAHPAERARRAAAALRVAQRHDWGRVTTAWFDLYDHLSQRGRAEWCAAGWQGRPAVPACAADPPVGPPTQRRRHTGVVSTSHDHATGRHRH